jgi:hypothetical protein
MNGHDYESIERHIREARRLRSEAVGEMLAAAWRRTAALISSAVIRIARTKQARPSVSPLKA